MEFYKLMQKRIHENVIMPLLPKATEIWKVDAPIFIKGVAAKPMKELVFLPLYMAHTYLVLDEVKMIWERYQSGGRYRPCALGSVEQRRAEPYWFMMPRLVEALHESTEYHKNKEIKKFVLDAKCVGYHKVFGIKQLNKVHLFASEDIVEEMLQKNITEFSWESVDTK